MASLKEYLINTVAGAALLGAGGTLVGLKVNDGRQDQQIEASSKLLPDIQKDVKATREAVIRLEAQQEVSRGSRQ